MPWQPHVRVTFVGHKPGTAIPRFELTETPDNLSGLYVGARPYWGQHQGHVIGKIGSKLISGIGVTAHYQRTWLVDFYSGPDFRLPRRVIILTEEPTEVPLEVPKDSPLLAPP